MEKMEKQMIISVLSKDRPGIVADITGIIFNLHGDLADLNQSVLGGYLTMILVAAFDDDVTPEDILAAVSHLKSETRLEVFVREMDTPIETAKSEFPDETYVVTAQGKNQSGLVFKMSDFCRRHFVNILDLSTSLDSDLYTMILQVDLSNVDSIDAFRSDLQVFSKETGLGVVMQHNDIFKATSEIALP